MAGRLVQCRNQQRTLTGYIGGARVERGEMNGWNMLKGSYNNNGVISVDA